jgi:predicted Fe-S protein YdhL (DUF1289 family)
MHIKFDNVYWTPYNNEILSWSEYEDKERKKVLEKQNCQLLFDVKSLRQNRTINKNWA